MANYHEQKYLVPHNFNYLMPIPKILHLPLANPLELQIEHLISLYQSPYMSEIMRTNLLLLKILIYSFELSPKILMKK